uniref:Uncharacterized protein n=1 Tax=biofilter metagenome TaxID=1070537 RepID=A0A193SD04_9ZZZZ
MAAIENAATSPETLAEWRASLQSMHRSELLAQQLIQRGAEHALANLQDIGATTENCAAMLSSAREGLIEIHAAAFARGIELIGYDHPGEAKEGPSE